MPKDPWASYFNAHTDEADILTFWAGSRKCSQISWILVLHFPLGTEISFQPNKGLEFGAYLVSH